MLIRSSSNLIKRKRTKMMQSLTFETVSNHNQHQRQYRYIKKGLLHWRGMPCIILAIFLLPSLTLYCSSFPITHHSHGSSNKNKNGYTNLSHSMRDEKYIHLEKYKKDDDLDDSTGQCHICGGVVNDTNEKRNTSTRRYNYNNDKNYDYGYDSNREEEEMVDYNHWYYQYDEAAVFETLGRQTMTCQDVQRHIHNTHISINSSECKSFQMQARMNCDCKRQQMKTIGADQMSENIAIGTKTNVIRQDTSNSTTSINTSFNSSSALNSTLTPSLFPTSTPSLLPTMTPSINFSSSPTSIPSLNSSTKPTFLPTTSQNPSTSHYPTKTQSSSPSERPSINSTSLPSSQPSISNSPTIYTSTIPSISSSPTKLFSNIPSNAPSNAPSHQPSTLPSSVPSTIPSKLPSSQPSKLKSDEPSLKFSSRPSMGPSFQPSSTPSMKPSSKPSLTPSMKPSSKPSSNPSSQPSMYPSSFFERDVNCTELEEMNGDLQSNLLSSFDFLTHDRVNTKQQRYSLDMTTIRSEVDDLEDEDGVVFMYDLQSLLRNLVSINFIDSCHDDAMRRKRSRVLGGRRRMQVLPGEDRVDIGHGNTSSGDVGYRKKGSSQSQQGTIIEMLEDAGIKIFLVDFTDLEWKGNKSKCANNEKLEKGFKCFVIEGTFNVFYTNMQNTASSSQSINLIEVVQTVFKNELKDLPNEVSSIEIIEFSSDKTIVDKNTPINQFGSGNGNNSLSSSTKALIGVAIACSLLIIAAILIIRRGRNKTTQRQGTNYSQVVETTGIIPDRHIRSDDSVSNSPTMSSGARVGTGVAGGWDDAAHSEGSSRSGSASDTSSRPSFAIQLDEASQASHGIEASRSSLYDDKGYSRTYLPSSVLKDLLDGNGRRKSFDALDTVDL